MRRTITLIFAALVTVLSGCATQTGYLDSKGVVSSKDGVLLLSLTVNTDKSTHDSWYFFRKKGTTDVQRLEATGYSMFGKANDFQGLGNRAGRLLALPLEPGDYELVKWQLYIQAMGGYGYISPTSQPLPLPFRIEPGKVTYIGRLHLETAMGRNMFWAPIPVGGIPESTNRIDVDRALLNGKYPQLRDWPIRESILDLAAWRTH